MVDNRRESYRASIAEQVAATLICGRRRTVVEVVEESAGGLTVVADREPRLPLEVELELVFDDGRSTRVVVKNCQQVGASFRIGLQRTEGGETGIDLRSEFVIRQTKGLSIGWYVGVLIVGLLAGLTLQSEFVRNRLMGIAAIRAVLSTN